VVSRRAASAPAVLLAALFLAVGAAPAGADTPPGYSLLKRSGHTLRYFATSGHTNNVEIWRDGDELHVYDGGQNIYPDFDTLYGACESVANDNHHDIVCDRDDSRIAHLTGFHAALDDGDDTFREPQKAVGLKLVIGGGYGDDTLDLSGGDSGTLGGGGGIDHLTGSGGNDVLKGGDDKDYLAGGGGNDFLQGGGGVAYGVGDDVRGGPGNDTLEGSCCNDFLDGGTGDDVMTSTGVGPDTFFGGPGGDRVSYADRSAPLRIQIGAAGASGQANEHDTVDKSVENIIGGHSNDVIIGSGSRNSVAGLEGADLIAGGGGRDILIGDEGNDVLSGEADDDTLYGQAGNDSLIGASGADDLNGGSEVDTALYTDPDHSNAQVHVTLDNKPNDGFPAFGGEMDNVHSDVENLVGTRGPDQLTGNNHRNRLSGLGGGDKLSGAGASDRLYGGDANDTLSGGDGNDLASGGDGNDNVYGGRGDDRLDGGLGQDYFLAGDGDDKLTLVDGGIADNAYCGNDNDIVYVYPGAPDTIHSDCEHVQAP
jgi:Ca2+-binding RTX toxin-like protein